jgi:hypothetical protein
MRKAAIAQWVLSLFVSPDRASALVGDLLEQSRFSWFVVGRVAVSAVLRDFLNLRVVLLAVQALILQLGAVFCLGCRAPGREMPACVALVFLQIAFIWMAFARHANVAIHFTIAIQEMPLFIGARWARRTKLKHA